MKVAIHYYGRLAAKQGWRFDSTYDHKDETGEPIPFTFVLGSDNVSPDFLQQLFTELVKYFYYIVCAAWISPCSFDCESGHLFNLL